MNYRPNGIQAMPPVVKNILIINVILFLMVNIFPNLTELLSFHYYKSPLFKPFQFLTYGFLHKDFFHIIFNMLGLYMFGTVLENLWGPKKFLQFYILCLLGAVIIQTAYDHYLISNLASSLSEFYANPNPGKFIEIIEGALKREMNHLSDQSATSITDFASNWQHQVEIPQEHSKFVQEANDFFDMMLKQRINSTMLGASGAIMGLVMAFVLLFPNTEMMLMFIPIPIKAKYLILILIAIDLFFAFIPIAGDNIAHFAHLGGLLTGLIIMLLEPTNKNKLF